MAFFMTKWARMLEPDDILDEYEKAAAHVKALDGFGVDFATLVGPSVIQTFCT